MREAAPVKVVTGAKPVELAAVPEILVGVVVPLVYFGGALAGMTGAAGEVAGEVAAAGVLGRH